MFKKLIIGVVIVAVSTGAVARDIVVNFADGDQHTFENAPDSVTPEMVIQRIRKDFPGRTIDSIQGTTDEQSTKPSESTFWPTVGKIVVGVLVIGALAYGVRHIPAAKAYPCTLPTDRAKDGTLCGGRASSVKPGGR
jgi:hypothetical protein